MDYISLQTIATTLNVNRTTIQRELRKSNIKITTKLGGDYVTVGTAVCLTLKLRPDLNPDEIWG